MPDLYRASIDLPAKAADVYAYTADPATGPLVSNAQEASEVERDGALVKSFKTKHGLVHYVTQAAPHFLACEEQRKNFRTRYDIRCEAVGDAQTRLSIDVNIQPQSMRAKLQGPLPRLRAKGQLSDWLEQVQQYFSAKKK